MWLQRTMLSPFVNMVYAKRQNSCINGKWVIFVWLERCMRRRCCRRRHSLLTYHIFEKDALIPFDVMLFLRIPIMKFRFHFPNDFHFIEVAKLSYDFRNQMYCILIRVALLPHLLIFNQGIWWIIFVYKIYLTTHLFGVIFLLWLLYMLVNFLGYEIKDVNACGKILTMRILYTCIWIEWCFNFREFTESKEFLDG